MLRFLQTQQVEMAFWGCALSSKSRRVSLGMLRGRLLFAPELNNPTGLGKQNRKKTHETKNRQKCELMVGGVDSKTQFPKSGVSCRGFYMKTAK